jgi:hypothetical protein
MAKTNYHLGLLICSIIIMLSCTRESRVSLFDGEDLNDWTGIVFDSITHPDEVFQVKNGNILVTGEPHGYLITKGSYSNYKLHLEWRWTEEPGNSGVFIHCQEINESAWPICIESQLKHENAGLIIIKGHGTSLTIGDSTYRVPQSKKIPMMEKSSENAPGEWNVFEITCDNDNIELVVNGVVQNSASKSTLKSGNIALQSEGGPLEFRNLYINQLNK